MMVAWYWLILAFSMGGSLGFLGGVIFIVDRQGYQARHDHAEQP
jgi:hypothetical protein